MPEALLKLPVVQERTGLSRSAIYQGVADKTFPAQVHLGPRSVGWVESEIDGWIRERVAESRRERAA
jgi:prophage regulatory protein